MTTYTPAYRMTLYASVSPTNPNETTVLTPAASAPHTGSFQVATKQGISGYAPYLGIPRGGGSKVELPESQTSIGEFSVDLYDFRTGTNNAERFVSAFIGDSERANQLVGRKAVIEESLDGGSSWSVFYVGRVYDCVLKDAQTYTMKIRDVAQGLKIPLFDRTTYDDSLISYLAYEMLFPIGFNTRVGTIAADTLFTATITNVANVPATEFGSGYSGQVFTFSVDSDYWYNERNIITPKLTEAAKKFNDVASTGYFESNCVGVMYNVTQGSTKEVTVGELFPKRSTSGLDFLSGFKALARFAYPLSGWVKGDVVQFYFKSRVPEQNARLWLKDVHPVQLWKDILDGKFFGSGSDGTSPFRMPYDSAAMTALLTDAAIQPTGSTFAIEKPTTVNEFIEKHICLPYGLAYGVRQVGTDSVIYPFKTSLPSTLPSYTITDDDVNVEEPLDWTPGRPLTSVTYTFYATEPNFNPTNFQESNGEAFKETPWVTPWYNPDGAYAGGGSLAVDAIGVRFVGFAYELDQGNVQNMANRNLANLVSRFGNGTPEIGMTVRRTGVIASSSVGDWVILDIERLPDANTNRRGGPRLAQVVEKTPMIGGYLMRFLDGGLTSSMATPTINSLALHPSSSQYGVRASVTTTESSSVRVEYAAVAVGASAPAQTSLAWTYARQEPFAVQTKNVDVWNVPTSRSIWLRVRADSPTNATLKLPSAWVVSSTSVTTSGTIAPSGLTITGITQGFATASWTNGSPQAIELLIANPSGSVPTASLAVLESGSTKYVLSGLNEYSSSTFTVGVRHIQPLSAMVTASFNASGTIGQLPSMSFFMVYRSG